MITDTLLAYENLVKHTAYTIVLWSKGWLKFNTYFRYNGDRQITCKLSLSSEKNGSVHSIKQRVTIMTHMKIMVIMIKTVIIMVIIIMPSAS